MCYDKTSFSVALNMSQTYKVYHLPRGEDPAIQPGWAAKIGPLTINGSNKTCNDTAALRGVCQLYFHISKRHSVTVNHDIILHIKKPPRRHRAARGW